MSKGRLSIEFLNLSKGPLNCKIFFDLDSVERTDFEYVFIVLLFFIFCTFVHSISLQFVFELKF